ncbi:MAG: YIP1 family protein [Pseudomonadota bacterium]
MSDGSLTARAWAAWRNPAASWRAEAPGATEGRLLAFAFGAALFLTLGRIGAEMIRPELAVGEERIAWFAATVFIGFSFGALSLYAVAAMIRIVSRLFGGEGGWRATRLALFWSGLAAGPVILIGYLIGAVIDGRALAGLCGAMLWGLIFAPMLAEAHGFSPRRVAIVSAGLFLIAASLTFIV